ncbi:MAG: hypothetical protein NVS9B10_01570 [Nevskia sp.]
MPRPQLTVTELETMRQRLSAAALVIYREDGLEALSFRRLADAVGLSHTLPYRYFENKDALLARLRSDCTRDFDAFVRRRERRHRAPLDRIRAVVEAYVDYVRRHPAEYLLMFSTHQPPPTLYPELLAVRRGLFEHAVSVMQGALDAGLVAGDARELSHAMWVTLHGLMTLHVANQLVHGLSLEQLVEPIIERVLSAHAPATPARAAPKKAKKPAATAAPSPAHRRKRRVQ